MPGIPGGHPGPKPPQTPRHITAAYRRDTMYFKNVYTLIGVVFTIPFFWTVIFPIIGVWMWRKGLTLGKRKLAALEFGIPTKGELISVDLDTSQHINHIHPWQLRYRFETPEGVFEDETISWDQANTSRPPGEHLWVVYVPNDRSNNNIWPPIR